MNTKEFETKIKKELKKLNREQVALFAWRCAVRALPFLGAAGNFNFWYPKDRQKYIFAVFNTLDFSASRAAARDADRDPARAAIAASRAAVRDADIHDSIDVSIVAASASIDTRAAISAISAARDAIYASRDARAAIAAAIDARASIAASIDTRDAIAASRAASSNYTNLESIIFQDLKTIQRGGDKPGDGYGAVWDVFQEALEAEDCGYWGELYRDIFDNGFVFDPEALERRMNVPKEIREQGAAAVAVFLEELEIGATRLNEARIIILGEKGAGKTCIARRLIDPSAPMTTEDESTPGVDTMLWKLKNEKINVSIWDFAGHTVTHAVHQFFLSERCLYLMVYDGRTEERNRLEYWLNHMKHFGGDSKAIILVNKRDKHRVDIPIKNLKEQYSIEGEIYTFSIQDDKKDLKDFRKVVAGYIQNNPSWNKQEIPTNYYEVKEELEKLFIKGEKDKGREHITKEEFDKIAKKHNIENIEELLKGLHALGVGLWYKDMEDYNTLVLNPEWISDGVYKIINWVNEEKKHSLTLNDFAIVFKDNANRYPKEKHKFLFKLMIRYELAYKTKIGNELIIPHLLKEDRPTELPDFPVGESLMLRYKAEQPLPPNTISRFIVRHNQEIKKEKKDYLVWRYGIVLKDDKGSIALVHEKDRAISVSVKGPEKTNYISTLRKTLNDIFISYKSDNPELQYKVERFEQITDVLDVIDPLWLRDSKIYNHFLKEKPYYDDLTDRNISMSVVVNIYKIEAENVISGGQGHTFIKNNFNFHDCNINLQGNLNELAQSLSKDGYKEEAKELEIAAKALEQTEKCEQPEELKKKGIAGRLKRIADELANEDSKLHKTVKGIKDGISIAQDIAKGYNDIAQWVGWPQVPKPFLKK